MYRLVLVFSSAFLLFVSPAGAKDTHQDLWVVSQLSGEARVVHAGLSPASLKVNSTLSAGDLIVTGPSGRAMLSHNNADYIVIAPRSELRLPTEAQPNGFTRVIQKVGTMLFRVQHTGIPHFAVDTPMLAAVVKGTTFTITVDQNRSAVQVTQGVVEVSANDGGMKQLVEGGRTVFITIRDPKTIIDADLQPTKTSAPSAAAVKVTGTSAASITTIASLMSGLVRPEAAPPPPPQAVAPAVAVITTVAAVPVTSAPAAVLPTSDASAIVTGPVSGIVADLTEPNGGTIGTITAPVTDTIGTVTQPVSGGAVGAPVTDVIGSTTAPVTDIVGSVTAPVTDVIGAVTQPVTDVVSTVTQPVTDVVSTVTQPVTDVVDTVTQPVTDVVDTVTQPVTNLLGGLLGSSSTTTTTTSPPPPPPPLLGLHL